MSPALKAWIKRNQEGLDAEYHSYRMRHDYCPDCTLHPPRFHTFEAWAANEYMETKMAFGRSADAWAKENLG